MLDGGKTRVGIESTIIRLQPDGFQLLRPGVITREDLVQILPESAAPTTSPSPEAPGMLASHYSPKKPFFLVSPEVLGRTDPSRAGYIAFRGKAPGGYRKALTLSPQGDLKQYAARMFGAMHEMEASDVEVILAEPVPEEGIGVAIMDRLRKAAHSHQ